MPTIQYFNEQTNDHKSIEYHTKSWMHDLAFLNNMALKDICIPGSHDSGTYMMAHKIANNASKCQALDIKGQLEAGSRYLDLRAALYENELWLYHGSDWTNVKLDVALDQINAFLNANTQEIVIATLLIYDTDETLTCWDHATNKVKNHMAKLADFNGKNFSQVSLQELRDKNTRLVFLLTGDPSQLACMDREGAYGNSNLPENYIKVVERYAIWDDRMWILHLGIPYTGDIGNTMPTRAEWNASIFIPKFKKEWNQRRFNIINVDYIEQFGWVEAIINLNAHTKKTSPQVMTPIINEATYEWTLTARNKNGKLQIESSSTAPFRAQQGKIHIYKDRHSFPVNPDANVQDWAWDNEAHSWDTGIKWEDDMCIAWVAERPANGPRVYLLQLKLSKHQHTAKKAYTWKLRHAYSKELLIYDCDTDAPFRAQQGQIHIYPLNSHFTLPKAGHPEHSKWDNEAHPWKTDIKSGVHRMAAWVAQKSPNDEYVVITHT